MAFIKHIPNTNVCGKSHTCLLKDKRQTCVSFSIQEVVLFGTFSEERADAFADAEDPA